jgi:DNA helicase HerA-like ATPase
MQLGTITGKTTTRSFAFEAKSRVRKTDYISVKDPEGNLVLAGIDNISTEGHKTRAEAAVIGFRDSRGFLKGPAVPFSPGSPVFAAESRFIRDIIGLRDSGLYVGILDGYDLKVRLPAESLIKKHISVLAKTGAGKSYLTGVILEELLENGIPAVVIDPHGEYWTLQGPNQKESETRLMARFGVEPKSYKDRVNMLGFRKDNEIRMDSRMAADELASILPSVSVSQKSLLYPAVRKLQGQEYTFHDVISEVGKSKSPAKWGLLSSLEGLMSTGIFSTKPTPPQELVQDGRISIVDLKAAKPEIQRMVVMKLAEELFSARKQGKIPAFLFVLEEAHNFCPERGFGEVASSRILRTIASEGRKFGMGLMVVSQRPARVDKSVLSQCNTQVILKVTNPNDLKAITDSVEGMGIGVKESIRDLPVGVAMVVGISEQPLIVDVRIRRSEHGGESAVNEQGTPDYEESHARAFQPKVRKEDVLLRYKGADSIDILRYPLWRVSLKDGKSLYIDGFSGHLVFEKEGRLERREIGGARPRELHGIRKEPSPAPSEGISFEPAISQAKVKKSLLRWKMEPENMELVHYPYWIIKSKGKKVLVDALSERMDTAATASVSDRI